MQEMAEEFETEISDDAVLIHALQLIDPEVVTILRECRDKKEIEEKLQQAIKIGLILTRNGKNVQNIDYVEKNFQQFSYDMKESFSVLKENVAEYFGPKGSITTLFDTSNKKGLVSKLLDDMTRQIQDLLNVTSDTTALGMLRRDLQKNFMDLHAVVNQLVGKKSEFEKGSLKGVKFEDDLFDFFSERSRISGDRIEKTGAVARGRDKKGDLVITLNEPNIAEELVIVIEAKDTGSISVEGKDGLLSQVEQGIVNRNADFGIGVVKNPESLPKSNGPLRYYPDRNIIICGYGDDGFPLELAFIFARTILTQRVSQDIDSNELDLEELERVFNDISNKLRVIRSIKKNMTEIEKLTTTTKTELDNLDNDIRDLVTEGLESLQETSKEE